MGGEYQMKPMGWKGSFLLFGIIGAIAYLLIMFVMQPLNELGIPRFWLILFGGFGPVVFLCVLAIIDCKKKGVPFKEYFWVKKLNWKEWLMVFGGLILVQVFELIILSNTDTFIIELFNINVPEFYPEIFKPDMQIDFPMQSFMDIPVIGNPISIVLWGLLLIFNIFGEELLWRGYALPRMEKYFGKWAWLVNGVMWIYLFHFFMIWKAIALIPSMIVIPYLCQKTKSIWPGIIIHGFGNAMFFLILIPSVFS